MPAWLTKILSFIPFNQGRPKVQLGVLLVVVLFLVGLATRCGAEEAYSQFGVGSTYIRGTAPVMDLAYVYPDAAPGDAVLEVGATFLGQSSTADNGVQRNNFAARAAIVEGLGRFRVGLGFAYLQNTDTYNGSNLNFNLILGYDVKTIPVTLRIHHFSNGGTRSPNKGRDMLLIYWRFH